MFENELATKLKKIFDFDKVSYDIALDAREQETLFVDILKARPTIKDQKQLAMVEGKISVFANSQKLPFGYFAKKIAQAESTLTKDFHFYDFEENVNLYKNIARRDISFIYFFEGQYNTNDYKIEDINFVIN